MKERESRRDDSGQNLVMDSGSKNTKKRRNYIPLFVADDTTDEEFFGTTKTTEKYRDNFYSMCRDGPSLWRNATVDSALRCRTVHFNDPYLKLGPFKMEEKSDRPFLVVFYDFLTGEELKVSGFFPPPKIWEAIVRVFFSALLWRTLTTTRRKFELGDFLAELGQNFA